MIFVIATSSSRFLLSPNKSLISNNLFLLKMGWSGSLSNFLKIMNIANVNSLKYKWFYFRDNWENTIAQSISFQSIQFILLYLLILLYFKVILTVKNDIHKLEDKLPQRNVNYYIIQRWNERWLRYINIYEVSMAFFEPVAIASTCFKYS